MTPKHPHILIIDDEPGVCWALTELAKSLGYSAQAVPDAAGGLARLAGGAFDAVVLDIQLPGLNGLEALPRIKADHPELPVIVITAHGTMETAVAAIQRGAFEYLLKPVDMATLKTVLSAAVERRRRSLELTRVAPTAVIESAMVGRCAAMQEVFKQLALVAATDMAVLIQGETGTGKELAARAIHRFSARSGGPFVAVNCSLLSGELIASELFGHEKGAFTGADRPAPGKVEVAQGGTLLLDEVGDLSQEAQARLLRFLDDGEFYRVGSVQPRQADARIIAATNRSLRASALGGQFRRDLFFRVSGVTIELPPLRQREGDLDLLIDHFIARCQAVPSLSRGGHFAGGPQTAARLPLPGQRPRTPQRPGTRCRHGRRPADRAGAPARIHPWLRGDLRGLLAGAVGQGDPGAGPGRRRAGRLRTGHGAVGRAAAGGGHETFRGQPGPPGRRLEHASLDPPQEAAQAWIDPGGARGKVVGRTSCGEEETTANNEHRTRNVECRRKRQKQKQQQQRIMNTEQGMSNVEGRDRNKSSSNGE